MSPATHLPPSRAAAPGIPTLHSTGAAGVLWLLLGAVGSSPLGVPREQPWHR